MTDNIFYIADHRPSTEDEEEEFVCTLDIFHHPERGFRATGRHSGKDGLEVAKRLVKWADACSQLSYLLRQHAAKLGDADAEVVATAQVFLSGAVRTLVNDEKFTTEDQFKWLDDRFDGAKQSVRATEERGQ